jgi:hypothetical protein
MNYLGLLAWLVGLAGFGLLVAGVALLSVPAGFIAAGGGMLVWAYLADQAAATSAPVHDDGGG